MRTVTTKQSLSKTQFYRLTARVNSTHKLSICKYNQLLLADKNDSFPSRCRLHTTKNISTSPTLQIGVVFYIDADHGSLINKKKKKWKIALACLFFVVDVLIWCLSQQISVKNAFLSRTERFGSSSKWTSSFLSPRRKIEPVTTHKVASYLMDMNTIFQENMCLTDFNHHSKMTIFWVRFNTGKNRNCN